MERSTTKLQNARRKAAVTFKQFLFQHEEPAIFKRQRLKCEEYLLRSLEMAGFQSSELLKFSTMVDTEPMFVDHLKRLIRRTGI